MFRAAEPGEHHVITEGDIARTAAACVLEFSEVICSVAQELASQQRRMTDAATVLHNRLETLFHTSTVAPAPRSPPESHGAEVLDVALEFSNQESDEVERFLDEFEPELPSASVVGEVVGEVELPAPMSDEVEFILDEDECQEGVHIPVVAPDPRGFENHFEHVPYPLSPTASLSLSPVSCSPVSGDELLEEKDQLQTSQSSGEYVPFSDHYRVYDFGHNFAFCAQCCTASAKYGGCSLSDWDAFRVWPDSLCFSTNVAFNKNTLSGFLPSVNSIVVGYLGKFCVSTYRACVNVPPRETFCNHCRRWGHSFLLDSCTVRGYGASAALLVPVPWCAYCQKAGHVVENCRRRVGDRAYLQPPKRKRR